MEESTRLIEELSNKIAEKRSNIEALERDITQLEKERREQKEKYLDELRKSTLGKCYIIHRTYTWYIYVIPNDTNNKAKDCIKVSGDGITIEKIDLFSEVSHPSWDNRRFLIDYAVEISGKQFADFMSNTYIRMRQRVHFNNFKNKFKKD